MYPIKYYIKILMEQKKPLKFLLSRILWKTRLSNLIIINRDLFKIRCYPSSISIEYWLNSNARAEHENILKTYLRPDDIVIDIGANIGILTLTSAAIVGNNGAVYSIEAHPVTFKYLQGNVQLNNFKNIHLYNIAIGDKNGLVSITDKKYDDENEINKNGNFKIRIMKLDDLLNRSLKRVQFLKVDVEGYEKFVFLGGTEILKKTDVVYFEFIQRLYIKYGYMLSDIFEILNSVGFNIYMITNNEILRLSLLDIRSQRKDIPDNLFAIRDIDGFMKRTGNKFQLNSLYID